MRDILLGFAFIHEDKIHSLENMSVKLVKSLELTQKIFEPKTKKNLIIICGITSGFTGLEYETKSYMNEFEVLEIQCIRSAYFVGLSSYRQMQRCNDTFLTSSTI